MQPFPDKKYNVILSDPPWSFLVYSDKGKDRSAEKHYNTMTIDDIKAMDVQSIANDDCVLLMWTTWPNLLDGIDTIKAWGFEYKTCAFDWAKKNKKSSGFFMGMGYWTRANTEPCLLATRGNPKRVAKDVRQLLVTRLREHSRKPEEQYGRIESLLEGPYIELFARNTRPGWDSWGNQVGKFGET